MPNLSFLPREEKFFDLFEESADNAVKVAEALQDLVNNWADLDKKPDKAGLCRNCTATPQGRYAY